MSPGSERYPAATKVTNKYLQSLPESACSLEEGFFSPRSRGYFFRSVPDNRQLTKNDQKMLRKTEIEISKERVCSSLNPQGEKPWSFCCFHSSQYGVQRSQWQTGNKAPNSTGLERGGRGRGLLTRANHSLLSLPQIYFSNSSWLQQEASLSGGQPPNIAQ